MDDFWDITAEMDQQEQVAKDMARPVIAFWRTLTDSGMHEVTVNEVTRIYAAGMFQGPRGE